MKYDSIAELVVLAEAQGTTISRIVLAEQAESTETSEQAIFEKMKASLQVMKQAAVEGMEPDRRSVSGLTGGDAYKMQQAVNENRNICGKVFGTALAKALAVSETNACMGRIVAAPTAGSCGILPAVLLAVAEGRHIDDDTLVMGLLTASGIGMVIANNATLAGAEGGCQAECGAASAMAAAAVTEICGGTPKMAEHACAIAIKNILGLVCDPVAGLVEIPCIKRNAMGTANALTAAELALAGIASAIPADETIIAMKHIGDTMSPALRETADGGLATTPTGIKLRKQVFGA